MPEHAPLWCLSNFSFLEGASHPEELVEQAQHLGIRHLALTDRDGVYGVVRAHLKARELGLHLIIGSELSLDDQSRILLLVQDRAGYRNLCRLISQGRLRSPKGACQIRWSEVLAHAGGLLALWGGAQAALSAETWDPALGSALREAFGDRLYALLARHCRADERAAEQRLCARAAELRIPLLAASQVLYHTLARRPLQDVLACLRHGVTLSTAGQRIQPNAEHALRSHEAFAALFKDQPAAVERTLEVAARCRFSLGELRYRYPLEDLPDGRSQSEWLRELTYRGAEARYAQPASGPASNGSADHAPSTMSPGAHARDAQGDGAARPWPGPQSAAPTPPVLINSAPAGAPSPTSQALSAPSQQCEQASSLGAPAGSCIPPEVMAQLERELDLIEELDYGGYFLTMYEIVQFCRSHGILCQGRGSAANSAVCYCLGVTAIDPVRMGLLFERFLSRERAEPPDIDLDIAHARREEVIQWVYERYGRERAAMVAVVVRFRTRSALREVGKVLGLPATGLDRLAKLHTHYEAVSESDLASSGLELAEPTRGLFLSLVNELLDFPRHLSIHPGGFLLGHEPVHDLVPIENGSMEERTVIQWDKDDVEALGLFKVDLLGLGALTQLDLAFQLLQQHRGVALSMATIPAADSTTFDRICAADTVGTFQIESRAQMSMLPRLRPRTFYDLVIEVSIVRPGPITGGMVHPYLRRRHGEEKVEYPHPCLEPVLAKTLGVPIFQEQVMKLAVVAADYTPGEADQLRRDMAAWRKAGRIERHRHRLIERMQAKGIEKEFAERVFDQIRGFGEYGFPESHAASFALISYATAYLKTHYHPEFSCSLLNAQPMGFYAASTLVEDAQRHGVQVRPIDVRVSAWDCTLEERATLEPSDSWKSRRDGADKAWDVGDGAPAGAEFTSTGGVGAADWGPGQGRAAPSPGASRKPAGEPVWSAPSRSFADPTRVPDTFGPLALRMGLRYVKGLGALDGERIRAAQATAGALDSLENFVRASGLDEGALVRLAEAGALDGFDVDRRQALWEVRRLVRERGQSLPLPSREILPAFEALDPLTTVGWDYEASLHSARGHPLQAMRPALSAQGLPDSAALNRLPDGRRAHFAGLVICRQRPGTASGVTFMTLEDEAGFVNVVVWRKVYEKFRVLLKTSAFIGVSGRLQVEQGVVHLIAERLWTPRLTQDVPTARSRDFH